MKNRLAIILLFTITILTIGCQSEEERLEKAMQKSTAWLWEQQSADGGWHSQTHAVLKDGKALTPYILYHLLLIPEARFTPPPGAIEKGVEFIRREIYTSMSMSKDSLPLLNYPNYSAAYALKVLCLLDRDTALQRILVNHLLKEQFIEHRGITPNNLAYGGWGYGEPDLQYGKHGHVDISHTRRITEALMDYQDTYLKANRGSAALREINNAEANPRLINLPNRISNNQYPYVREKLMTSVILFLKGAQRSLDDHRLYEGCTSRKDLPYDGGFISSAVTLATNKSQEVWMANAGYHYPSYATATCDGLLAMHSLDMTDSQPYKDAVRWLTKNQNMNTIDGLSPHDPEQWYQVMHYYHLAVRSEAMTKAQIKGKWSNELIRILIKEQTPEGYYINPIGGVNKEDDPLMATIFAVQAGWKVSPSHTALKIQTSYY